MEKKRERKRISSSSANAQIERVNKDLEKLNLVLIENFVNLQKAMTNITIKFEDLANQISKLLQLFEISAKSFAEKLSTNSPPDIEKDKEFLNKLNSLLEQNKVIARGLTLMEEKLREKLYGSQSPQFPPQQFSSQQSFDRNKSKPLRTY